MSLVIDDLYIELKNAESAAMAASPSTGIMLGDVARKYFVIATASYFEKRFTINLLGVTALLCNSNSTIVNFIELQAIKRKYHTLFDWDKSKATQFFSLFGKAFKEHMENIVTNNSALSTSISAFLEIGLYRNQLAHSDCTSYQFDKTLEELYVLYQAANIFVEEFPKHLQEFIPS